jgi:predicted ABC-type ATPase
MKRYVLLAGVNGAGKSTLFSLIPSLSKIQKVNMDDTVRTIGDWRDTKAVLQAGKLVVSRINDYFVNGISFSQETTLCGTSIIWNIQKAKNLGYNVEMHYVGLDSAETAKQRVMNRVLHGGHGIPERDIERRYVETLKNLKKVLPQCDLAAIYDNTEGFRRFAIYKDGKCAVISSRVPEWYQSVLKNSN